MPSIKLALKPFNVPNFVIVDTLPNPFSSSPTYALHEVDDEVLEEMIAQYRTTLLSKAAAGRRTGFRPAPGTPLKKSGTIILSPRAG